MKKNNLRSLTVLVLCGLTIGCSKDDQSSVVNSTEMSAFKVKPTIYTLNYPYNPTPSPGTDPKPALSFPSAPDNPWTEPKCPSTNILTPTTEYINETSLFDYSHLEVGKSYYQINNEKLKIAFSGPVTKMKPDNSPFGWSAHWGFSPFVENEAPEVLFSPTNVDITILLSKPCIEFGLEASPNLQGRDYEIGFYAGNYTFDDSAGHPSVTTHTPSGARLIAVKSKKPFRVVTFGWVRHSSVDSWPNGVAMANIRFKLAK